MSAARIRRMAEEIAIARCKAAPEADAATIARRALEEAEIIASVIAGRERAASGDAEIVSLRRTKAARLLRRHGIT